MNQNDVQRIDDARIKALALRKARALLLADKFVEDAGDGYTVTNAVDELREDYKSARADHEQTERDYERAKEIMEGLSR